MFGKLKQNKKLVQVLLLFLGVVNSNCQHIYPWRKDPNMLSIFRINIFEITNFINPEIEKLIESRKVMKIITDKKFGLIKKWGKKVEEMNKEFKEQKKDKIERNFDYYS